MLGLAKRTGARFLLTSTSEVYGDALEYPQKENYWGNANPIGVRGCYEEGKRVAETLAMDYHRSAGVQVRIARIFNTYGPRMSIDDGRVISNFVAQALRREPLTIYGDGNQTRSFQYISDLIAGLIKLMDGENVGPFNLGNPGEFTMLDLVEVIKETIDPSATVVFKPKTADDPHRRKPDITKAKQLLNWEPKIPLREGLSIMAKDFRRRIQNDRWKNDFPPRIGQDDVEIVQADQCIEQLISGVFSGRISAQIVQADREIVQDDSTVEMIGQTIALGEIQDDPGRSGFGLIVPGRCEYRPGRSVASSTFPLQNPGGCTSPAVSSPAKPPPRPSQAHSSRSRRVRAWIFAGNLHLDNLQAQPSRNFEDLTGVTHGLRRVYVFWTVDRSINGPDRAFPRFDPTAHSISRSISRPARSGPSIRNSGIESPPFDPLLLRSNRGI
ncbi:hypothetical protein KFK09_016927 [Dendrobium nobile]|uniref:UDP-glucuronate decarboxylase n=1 Tax=Dendrobium nobile TaxID=94219 RepID=A0A8T3B214_DENNO|nr:hypothetical protein KFK09_016927 [Dendrobium nobile]